MNKAIKHLEWKTLLIGTVATFTFVISLVAIASYLTDIVLFSVQKKAIVFSIAPEQVDSKFDAYWQRFYEQWFWIISLVVSSLGFLLGGLVTGLIAKGRFVLHGTIAGAIVAIVFLSWATPISIAAASYGAVLAMHKKLKNNFATQKT